MQAFKREVIHNLFYESPGDFVRAEPASYNPARDYLPLHNRDELEVDWFFPLQPKQIFLYGVRDDSKARPAALACREFQLNRVPFRSVIVHEDFESGLSKKDRARITNAADKQFTSLADFQNNAQEYFAREAESLPVQQATARRRRLSSTHSFHSPISMNYLIHLPRGTLQWNQRGSVYVTTLDVFTRPSSPPLCIHPVLRLQVSEPESLSARVRNCTTTRSR